MNDGSEIEQMVKQVAPDEEIRVDYDQQNEMVTLSLDFSVPDHDPLDEAMCDQIVHKCRRLCDPGVVFPNNKLKLGEGAQNKCQIITSHIETSMKILLFTPELQQRVQSAIDGLRASRNRVVQYLGECLLEQ